MTTEELLGALFDAWRTGDAHRASALFAPEAQYQEARHDVIAGRDAITAHFTRFFRDGPLWEFVVDEVITTLERAAVMYHFRVKGDDGTWRERAGCAVVHLQGGLITLWREYEG